MDYEHYREQFLLNSRLRVDVLSAAWAWVGNEMNDIVERIKSLRYVHVPVASQLFEEAIVEITSLRGDAEVARLRLEAAHAEIARLRLTDAEREALHHVVGDMADITGPVEDTLRGLLERTK